ncbi:conserved hypothetical protein (fragment) [Ralstonia solanacearum K60]
MEDALHGVRLDRALAGWDNGTVRRPRERAIRGPAACQESSDRPYPSWRRSARHPAPRGTKG